MDHLIRIDSKLTYLWIAALCFFLRHLARRSLISARIASEIFPKKIVENDKCAHALLKSLKERAMTHYDLIG